MLKLRVAEACDVPWEEMEARSSGRHCATCDRTVVDLTDATELQARAWLALHDGPRAASGARGDRLCGRLRAVAAVVGLAAADLALGCGHPPTAPAPAITFTADEASDAVASASAAPQPVIALKDPNTDTDGDGIQDDRDQCPREPGTRNGCPGFVGLILPEAGIKILERVEFDVQASRVSAGSFPLLDAVAAILKDHPEISRVAVVGFADDKEGAPEKLSELRANAVVDYLVSKGVDRARLLPAGRGSDEPIETSGTPEARAKNRRVQFEIERAPRP